MARLEKTRSSLSLNGQPSGSLTNPADHPLATATMYINHRQRCRRCVASAAISLGIAAPIARAQVIVQVDQKGGPVRLADVPGGGRLADVIDDGTLRFRHSATVRLQVVNTNTALYQYTTEDVATSGAQALEPIGKFLSSMKSYLPELALVAPVRRGRGPNEARRSMLPAAAPLAANRMAATAAEVALDNARVVEKELQQLDDLLRGPRGVDGVYQLSLRTLDKMRRAGVEAQANAMADSLGVPAQSCSESGSQAPRERGSNTAPLTLASDLLTALDGMRPDVGTLAASLSDTVFARDQTFSSFRAPLADVRARADSMLRDSDPLVSAAYRVEATATAVLTACSHWESPPLIISTGTGRSVTVRIEPKSDPDLQRVAANKPTAITVKLLPPLTRLDAKLGVSALYAPRAHFKTYGTRSTGGSGSPTEIYEAGDTDQRFSYGLTLGLTVHPWLDWRQATNIALWLPEVTVGETDAQHVFGLGIAFSYSIVKVGFGGLLAKHETLVAGDTVGRRIANAQFLNKTNTYGHPVPYFSISVFNLGKLLGGDDTPSGPTPPPPAAAGRAKK
jgi:hypothetical protein